jgi:hypothetical protein
MDVARVTAHSKLVQTLLVGRWPNAILARSNDPFGIHCILDGLVEAHENVIIPIVRFRDLVHHGQMSAILAPAVSCAICNQYLNEPVCSSLGVGVFAIKDNAHNMICRIWISDTLLAVVNLYLRISRRPTVNVPMKSKPASRARFFVTEYWSIASSPETLLMGEKNR